ncbi:hypothetical protein [Infectious spleen and kidney necrosis virus]|nr:hypothetical protein [Infectious spleen and kidney necrosis virus]WNH14607.1 hypothetical protein [Infectious spleen and kidney necrosis virus]
MSVLHCGYGRLHKLCRRRQVLPKPRTRTQTHRARRKRLRRHRKRTVPALLRAPQMSPGTQCV